MIESLKVLPVLIVFVQLYWHYQIWCANELGTVMSHVMHFVSQKIVRCLENIRENV